jgi:hypothetical protein
VTGIGIGIAGTSDHSPNKSQNCLRESLRQSEDDRDQTMQLTSGATAMTLRHSTAENAAALDSFLAAKFEIDALLARLQALSDDHFNASPDTVDWGHVGTLNHYRARLREITDMAFHEGEHAH